jgi:spore coat polysaccharide biosynthesis predicted glycosyltransferase SpsG
VLLRDEIRDWVEAEPPWRDPPERAVVTMGGSDIGNLTPTVIRAFDRTDLRVDAIVGPGCSETQHRAVETAAASVAADVRVVRDPDDLPKRMFAADFGVSTASSTVYELLALGTPLACVPVAANQQPIAAALRKRAAATVLERETECDTFRQAIENYLSDTALRCDRQERGRKLVDGRGVERIADAIYEIVGI